MLRYCLSLDLDGCMDLLSPQVVPVCLFNIFLQGLEVTSTYGDVPQVPLLLP